MDLQLDLFNGKANPVWDSLWQELQKRLEVLRPFEASEVPGIKLCIDACNVSLRKLKDSLSQNDLASKEEEIYFFKNVKPKFYSQLIFYGEIFNLQTRKPIGDKETIKKYFRRELYRLRVNAERYGTFYEYHRSGLNNLDEQYFQRSPEQTIYATSHDTFDMDRQFSTGYDHILAILISSDLFATYITEQINKLDAIDHHQDSTQGEYSLTWTTTVIYLVELVYALYAFSPFNNTKVNPTRIMKCLCVAFNIQINSLSKKFEEIRIRKKNRIVFLNLLISALQRQMEEDDLNAL